MKQLETFKFDHPNSGYLCDGEFWETKSLLNAVKEQRCRVETIHLNSRDWSVGFCGSEGLRYIDLACHVKRCMEVDMSYPIILSYHGNIVDGRHRVLKALACNHKTIKAYRLDHLPKPDRRTT